MKCLTRSLRKIHIEKNGLRRTGFGKIVFEKIVFGINDWGKRFEKNSYWENWIMGMGLYVVLY